MNGTGGLNSIGEINGLCHTECTNSNQAHRCWLCGREMASMRGEGQESRCMRTKADKSYHGIDSKGMDGQQDQPSAGQYAFPVRCLPWSPLEGSGNGSWRTLLIPWVLVFLQYGMTHARKQGRGNAQAIKNALADSLSLASISDPHKRTMTRGMMNTTIKAIIGYCHHC